MDLFAAERTNAKALSPVKVCALALFLLSGVLLGASLLMQPPPELRSGEGAPARATGSIP